MATVTTAPSRAATSAPTAARSPRKPLNPGRIVAWTVMVIVILVTLFPFYWMLRTSFSTSVSLFRAPGQLGPVDQIGRAHV